jgi:hypothetical protein
MAEKTAKTLTGGAGLLVNFFLADDGVSLPRLSLLHDTRWLNFGT